MRADIDRHASGDPTAILMNVHDAALPHEFTAAIKYVPQERASELPAGMLAAGHALLPGQVPFKVYGREVLAAFPVQGGHAPSFEEGVSIVHLHSLL